MAAGIRGLQAETRIDRTIQFGEKCIEVSKRKQERMGDDAEGYYYEISYRDGINDMLYALRTEEVGDD